MDWDEEVYQEEQKEPPAFKIGEYVMHDEDGVGIVTDNCGEYRIDYIQETGMQGGNGPVYRKGYPKPVTDMKYILLCKQHELATQIYQLEKELTRARTDLEAVRRTRQILGG